jgi:tRNA threonylcarbamoyladenosine biosynthesis protein TsaB
MALILCIETATGVCSVALFRDEVQLGIRESTASNVHSSMLTTFMDEVVKSSGIHYNDLDAVAVSMGPGSYTGLRIGVATAKGLCYALDKPLIAIPTLQSMAGGMNCQLPTANRQPPTANFQLPTLFCPLIDARRMEVYSALYDEHCIEVREVRAEIIDDFSFQDYLANHRVVFGGDGAQKCKPLFENHPNALFPADFSVSAGSMLPFARERFNRGQFENLAYFEPFYLKDFVAGKPRVKGLR